MYSENNCVRIGNLARLKNHANPDETSELIKQSNNI